MFKPLVKLNLIFSLLIMLGQLAYSDELAFSSLAGSDPDSQVKEVSRGGWEIDEEKYSLDKAPYKGTSKSVLDWENLDPYDWLSFDKWKAQRKKRDLQLDWKIKVRDSQHRELIGKVIQCLGDCFSSNEDGKTPIQAMSSIYEGDEISTKAASSMWIFMIDGGLIRLSSESSITFLEVNLLKFKIFFNLRLNAGHFYYQKRQLGTFKVEDLPETDLSFLPLIQAKSNREEFMREEFNFLGEYQQMDYVLEKNPGHLSQYNDLNRLLNEHAQSFQNWDTQLIVFTPNLTLYAQNPIFHLFYEVLSSSDFKFMNAVRGLEVKDRRKSFAYAFYRGYTNLDSVKLKKDQWYRMDKIGRSISMTKGMDQKISVLDFFLKRIPSIHLARELYLKKHSVFFALERKKSFNEESVAVKGGYRLWSAKELKARKEFLVSFIRRFETTNLVMQEKVFQSKVPHGLDKRYYKSSLKETLLKLKTIMGQKREIIKELNNTEFYLWILKNAQQFLPTYTGK